MPTLKLCDESVGTAPVTYRSSGRSSERKLAILANSHCRPVAAVRQIWANDWCSVIADYCGWSKDPGATLLRLSTSSGNETKQSCVLPDSSTTRRCRASLAKNIGANCMQCLGRADNREQRLATCEANVDCLPETFVDDLVTKPQDDCLSLKPFEARDGV